MSCDLNVVLICISLMAKDVETFFFMYLLAIYTSSFGNCFLNSFTHLLIGFFVLLVFNFLSSLYSLECQMNSWQIFTPFCRLSLYSAIISFSIRSILI
jgi:hypothetical protein